MYPSLGNIWMRTNSFENYYGVNNLWELLWCGYYGVNNLLLFIGNEAVLGIEVEE